MERRAAAVRPLRRTEPLRSVEDRKRLKAEVLTQLAEKVEPVTLAHERVLDVPECLTPLCPQGGIPRGWSVGHQGPGARSLAMAVLATALGSEGWAAVVGSGDFGWWAAAEMGVRLDRVIVVEPPPRGQWSAVVAAVLGSVEVVVLDGSVAVGPRDARRLQTRAREQETTMFHLPNGSRPSEWPGSFDLRFDVTPQSWDGIGSGFGHLQSRQATVAATGRRAGLRSASVSIWLPGPDGGIGSAPAASRRAVRAPVEVDRVRATG